MPRFSFFWMPLAALLFGLTTPLAAAPSASPSTPSAAPPDAVAERQFNRCIELVLAVEEPAELDRPRPIYRDCPHLPPLEGLTDPLGMSLPEGERFTLAQLLDIRAALASRRLSASEPLDEGRLQALLDETLVSEPPTIWERLLKWLNDLFPEEEESALPAWLEWLNDLDISQEQSEWLFDLSLTLVVLMALGILFNELRRLPLNRAARARRQGRVELEEGSEEALVEWPRIRQLPPREQASALLRHLLGLMQRRGLLADPRSRTARECVEAAAASRPEIRPAFAEVAEAADHDLFAGGPGTVADEALFEKAEGLRRQLQEGGKR